MYFVLKITLFLKRKKSYFSLQEVFHRTQLLSSHLQFWNTIGYEYDTSIASELAKPSQEALMKLFAVSFHFNRITITYH